MLVGPPQFGGLHPCRRAAFDHYRLRRSAQYARGAQPFAKHMYSLAGRRLVD